MTNRDNNITQDTIKYILKNKFLNRLTSIEYVVSEKCQNKCAYCYRVKKHNASQTYYIDPELIDIFNQNFMEMFDVDETFFHRRTSELFGGEALLDYQKVKEIIDKLYYKYKFQSITIPTNGRMINALSIYDLDKLFVDKKNNSLKCHLSISVDGALIDHTQRPLSKFGYMLAYDEKLEYEKLFEKCNRYNSGFHPMFSFDNYKAWFDTFKFFINKKIYPYLLEIRHSVNDEDILPSIEQLVYIKHYLLKAKFPKNILKKFNTINYSKIPRGLGCSALNCLTIMPNGDIPFCHRVIDPPWVIGNLLTKKLSIEKAINYKAGFHHANHPMCIKCVIRNVCTGGCLGANYEYWGDPWTPINAVCKYLICKYYIFARIFKEWEDGLKRDINIADLEKKFIRIYEEDLQKNTNMTLNEYISTIQKNMESINV